MKNKIFTGLTLAACLLISAFFSQPAAAQNKPVTCKVAKNNARFFVRATEKFIRLKKGTLLSWSIFDMQQGLIVVKAKVGSEWIQGEIKLDETTCN